MPDDRSLSFKYSRHCFSRHCSRCRTFPCATARVPEYVAGALLLRGTSRNDTCNVLAFLLEPLLSPLSSLLALRLSIVSITLLLVGCW